MWVAYIAQPESLQPLELGPLVTLVSASKEVLHSCARGVDAVTGMRNASEVIRFGVFEVDLRTGELADTGCAYVYLANHSRSYSCCWNTRVEW